MLNFLPSEDNATIALEFDGKASKEDLAKFNQAVEQKFGGQGNFNVYLVVRGFDGASIKAVLKELEIDAKRWSQYQKLAVISEQSLLGSMAKFADFLPGVKVEHFKLDEMEAAWEWIKSR